MIGWLFYKMFFDWLLFIFGRVERCCVECVFVYNGLVVICFVFFVKVYVWCKGIFFNLKGSLLLWICLKVYGRFIGFDWKRLEVFVLYWFILMYCRFSLLRFIVLSGYCDKYYSSLGEIKWIYYGGRNGI